MTLIFCQRNGDTFGHRSLRNNLVLGIAGFNHHFRSNSLLTSRPHGPQKGHPVVFVCSCGNHPSLTMEPARRSRKSKDKKDKKKKKSGVRTKFLIESLRQDYYALRDENDRLREIVQTNLPRHAADAILADCFDLTSPSARVSSIDELANKMPGMNIAEEDEEDDDY